MPHVCPILHRLRYYSHIVKGNCTLISDKRKHVEFYRSQLYYDKKKIHTVALEIEINT